MACTRLQGKVAVVTASTEGIGFAIAERLCAEGASVMISSRKQQNVDEAVAALQAKKYSVEGMTCHVSSGEDRTAMLKRTVEIFGPIDVLVSNAAVSPHFGDVLTTPEAAFDKIMSVNLKAAFLITRDAEPMMNDGGAVVYVSSYSGYAPFELLGIYGVSKTALFGLTKAMAKRLGCRGIRVNCIAPGVIATRFSKALYESDEAREQVEEGTILGRVGRVEECAGTVAYLCSQDAAYVTAETIVVAGGMPSRL